MGPCLFGLGFLGQCRMQVLLGFRQFLARLGRNLGSPFGEVLGGGRILFQLVLPGVQGVLQVQ